MSPEEKLQFGYWYAENVGWDLKINGVAVEVEHLDAWDVGHIPGWEHWRMVETATGQQWDQATWRQW